MIFILWHFVIQGNKNLSGQKIRVGRVTGNRHNFFCWPHGYTKMDGLPPEGGLNSKKVVIHNLLLKWMNLKKFVWKSSPLLDEF